MTEVSSEGAATLSHNPSYIIDIQQGNITAWRAVLRFEEHPLLRNMGLCRRMKVKPSAVSLRACGGTERDVTADNMAW